MYNIKTVATAAAAVVAVAGATVYTINHRRESAKTDVEKAVESFYSAEFLAFNAAQDEVSRRMLAGYYDDKPDSDYLDDTIVLYVNFLKK